MANPKCCSAGKIKEQIKNIFSIKKPVNLIFGISISTRVRHRLLIFHKYAQLSATIQIPKSLFAVVDPWEKGEQFTARGVEGQEYRF